MAMGNSGSLRRRSSVSYAKWGYLFLAPFFLAYLAFHFIPMISTIYYSFFEHYRVGLNQVGPNFVGFANYATLLSDGSLLEYGFNTIFMWLLGFLPQLVVSLLLAAWFTDIRLRLRSGFFKSIIYMPNLIMAAAFAMLFFAVFSPDGPANDILMMMGVIDEPYQFLQFAPGTRGLVAAMNFLMWFGNTTILLMAAVMGIDSSLFEAAEIDGARPGQQFFKVTLPLIRPILAYVLITSLIGGIQMFDIPEILTNGGGTPDRMSMTLVMFLNRHLYSENNGMAGALSVILLIVTAALSFTIYKFIGNSGAGAPKRKKAVKLGE